MSVILLKCFNPFEMAVFSTDKWNLMYCFVADDSQVVVVFPDLLGEPFGDPQEFVRREVAVHYKVDLPKSAEEWLNAVTSRQIFDGLADRSFDSFEDAYAEAKKLCNEGYEVRAFMIKRRIGELKNFPFDTDLGLRDRLRRLAQQDE
jgi:hypothetical protein